jgi:hypothetical protein
MDQFSHDVIDILQSIGAIATAGALIYTAKTYLRGRKSDQIKLAEGIYKDIRELERDRSQIYSQKEDYDHYIKDWNSRFFNTLEWLSFLSNENEIKGWLIKRYFKSLIIRCYEDIFTKAYEKEEDQKEFPEFTQLYHKLKSGYYDKRFFIHFHKHK